MDKKEQMLDCIRGRRRTRNFTEEQITQEQLEVLLEAAVWAPSGSNSQSWLFTAIQNRDALRHLNGLVCEAYTRWEPDDSYPAKHAAKKASQKEGYSFMYKAPTLIITSNVPGYQNAVADCALALENIFLMGEAMGLGSCYINHLHWLQQDAAIRAYLAGLGIPEGHVICGAAAVGHIGKATMAQKRKAGTINVVK